MELKLDLDREYGLVLEGGGARGAFQIGAWRALKEAGVKIKAVAGVSVGALNGAFVCMDDLELAERIWSSIRYSEIMDVDDQMFDHLVHLDWKNLDFKETAAELHRIFKDGGMDITPLRTLIEECVDEDRIRSSDCQLFATTFSLSDRKLMHVDVRSLPEGEIGDILMASAYMPVFKSERLGGKLYTDGAHFNNVPLDVLAERGMKDLLVVRIYGLGFDKERWYKVPEDVNVYRIAPSEDLGGILEFDVNRSRRNMQLGYFEGKRTLYGLAGRRFYLDAPGGEREYFEALLRDLDVYKRYLKLDKGFYESALGLRDYTERLFPKAAKRLKLESGWDYKDLYMGFLEELALYVQAEPLEIYTPQQLFALCCERLKERIP